MDLVSRLRRTSTACRLNIDQMTAVISHFVLAMLFYPDVMRKAQLELDRVLQGRPPRINDKPRLPYITAIFKESLRWGCPVPLGT